jgi:hypothetical protein
MALLAKNRGMVMAWPIPIILSRVLKIDARQMLKLEKHIPNKIVITKIPSIFRGLKEISMRMMIARIKMAIAWKIPRIPADRVLPRTIAEREVGVEINLLSCPRSRSQTIVIP